MKIRHKGIRESRMNMSSYVYIPQSQSIVCNPLYKQPAILVGARYLTISGKLDLSF